MESIPNSTIKSKPFAMLLSVLVLVAIVTILPCAYAQVSYTDADNPTGPMMAPGWATGIVMIGIMSGVGVFTAVRRH